MTNSEKQQIVVILKEYIGKFDSQNKAAISLKGVSPATVSNMINDKWESIKDDMWRNVAAQIKGDEAKGWVVVETSGYRLLNGLLTDAQANSNVFAAINEAGSGKSKTMELFSDMPNAYRLRCSEFWNRKYFLAELLSAMGCDHSGLTVSEMMYEAVSRLKKKEKPLLMLDEADKLTDQVLYFFITLYNELEDHCGIMLCATDHLKKRIMRGIKLNKKGYKEIYSRIGRKFIELPPVNYTDVAAICVANGVEDKNDIKKVWDDCDGDLRRVKRKVHAIKNIKQNGD
jgi:DNA transposition AAA+ family ATPase